MYKVRSWMTSGGNNNIIKYLNGGGLLRHAEVPSLLFAPQTDRESPLLTTIPQLTQSCSKAGVCSTKELIPRTILPRLTKFNSQTIAWHYLFLYFCQRFREINAIRVEILTNNYKHFKFYQL